MYEDIDFDSWTDEQEEAQIRKALDANKVKYVIREGRDFIARFPGGQTVTVPLSLSVDELTEIQKITDPFEQIQALLETTNGGNSESIEMIRKGTLIAAIQFVEKYFNVFGRLTKASLGE